MAVTTLELSSRWEGSAENDFGSLSMTITIFPEDDNSIAIWVPNEPQPMTAILFNLCTPGFEFPSEV
jgi:hypothetical protein